jgi:hypothetical protein
MDIGMTISDGVGSSSGFLRGRVFSMRRVWTPPSLFIGGFATFVMDDFF